MGTKALATVEEFAQLDDKPVVYLELEEGEVIEVPAGTLKHNLARDQILILLRGPEARQSGKAVAEQDYQLGPRLVRRPDVSFLTTRRFRQAELDSSVLPGAPDIAIEVVSASDSAERLRKKTREYFSAGAGAVWVVYPETKEVEIWEAPGHLFAVLSEAGTLQTSLIPGFSLPVSSIFDLSV